jgi:hypothetical protein
MGKRKPRTAESLAAENAKRRARNAEKLKRDMAKHMEDVCLHCAFFKAHADKWPDWKPNSGDDEGVAFNDLVRSAIKITAEVFSMMDEADQMTFMRHVMVSQAVHAATEGKDAIELKEVLAKVKVALNGPTKH